LRTIFINLLQYRLGPYTVLGYTGCGPLLKCFAGPAVFGYVAAIFFKFALQSLWFLVMWLRSFLDLLCRS